MTIDEAIEHCLEKSCDNSKCSNEHKQLAEWLKELKQLKNIIQEIDYIIGDFEWHYCLEGTPQKEICELVWNYFKSN